MDIKIYQTQKVRGTELKTASWADQVAECTGQQSGIQYISSSNLWNVQITCLLWGIKQKCQEDKKSGRKAWLLWWQWHFCHWLLRGQDFPLRVASKYTGPDFFTEVWIHGHRQNHSWFTGGRVAGKSTRKCVWKYNGCSAYWRERKEVCSSPDIILTKFPY